MSLSHAQVSSWPWVLSCFCTSYIRYGVFSRLRCLRAVFHHRLHFIAHPLYPRSSLVTMVIPPLLEKTRTLNPLLSTGVDKVVRTSVLAWLSVIRSWRLSNSCIIFSLITVWWKQQKSVCSWWARFDVNLCVRASLMLLGLAQQCTNVFYIWIY